MILSHPDPASSHICSRLASEANLGFLVAGGSFTSRSTRISELPGLENSTRPVENLNKRPRAANRQILMNQHVGNQFTHRKGLDTP